MAMDNYEVQMNELKEELERANEIFNAFDSSKIEKIKRQKLIIICITIVMVASMILNGFLVYQLSQYEKVNEEITETYDIDNDIKQSINGNQYNDNSTHNEN